MQHPKERPWNAPNITFLAFIHLVAVGGTVACLVFHGLTVVAVL
jgi:hypothetical protein